jgi:hypothetical protein
VTASLKNDRGIGAVIPLKRDTFVRDYVLLRKPREPARSQELLGFDRLPWLQIPVPVTPETDECRLQLFLPCAPALDSLNYDVTYILDNSESMRSSDTVRFSMRRVLQRFASLDRSKLRFVRQRSVLRYDKEDVVLSRNNPLDLNGEVSLLDALVRNLPGIVAPKPKTNIRVIALVTDGLVSYKKGQLCIKRTPQLLAQIKGDLEVSVARFRDRAECLLFLPIIVAPDHSPGADDTVKAWNGWLWQELAIQSCPLLAGHRERLLSPLYVRGKDRRSDEREDEFLNELCLRVKEALDLLLVGRPHIAGVGPFSRDSFALALVPRFGERCSLEHADPKGSCMLVYRDGCTAIVGRVSQLGTQDRPSKIDVLWSGGTRIQVEFTSSNGRYPLRHTRDGAFHVCSLTPVDDAAVFVSTPEACDGLSREEGTDPGTFRTVSPLATAGNLNWGTFTTLVVGPADDLSVVHYSIQGHLYGDSLARLTAGAWLAAVCVALVFWACVLCLCIHTKGHLPTGWRQLKLFRWLAPVHYVAVSIIWGSTLMLWPRNTGTITVGSFVLLVAPAGVVVGLLLAFTRQPGLGRAILSSISALLLLVAGVWFLGCHFLCERWSPFGLDATVQAVAGFFVGLSIGAQVFFPKP